jgi:formate dehydrogenase (NADP+) beta subunit
MTEFTLKIDGQKVTTRGKMSVFEAAIAAGVYIPNLCYHPNLQSSGECRLCLVKVEGKEELAVSCITPAIENMVVYTNTPEIRQKQTEILKKLLAEHPTACPTCWRKEHCKPFDICLRNASITERCVTCPKNGRCELQKVAEYLELEPVEIPYTYRALPVNRDNPYFDLDYNLCIACGRCVRACNDFRKIKALDFININGYRVAGPVNGNHKDSGCKFCFSCVEVCPTGALVDQEARYLDIPSWETYVVPCRAACPAHIDVPRYINLIAQGKYSEATAVVREKAPFPGVLGRVCIHPCEQACRRDDLNKEEPICIKFLKRFAADHDKGTWKPLSLKAPPTGKRVAIIGSGPAGLTTAFYLAKKGHSPTVFEALPVAGGMMRVGIPSYRLPTDVLNDEINYIKDAGVEIKFNNKIESLDELFQSGFEAIFIGIGAHKGSKSDIKGENSTGVIDGIDFLREVSLGQNIKIGKTVAVIGGGNSAIDCARVALRIGAKKVTMVYRRTRAEMPAAPEEISEALHEGVEIIFLAAPVEIQSKNDKQLELVCTRMKLGDADSSGRRRPVPIKGSEFSQEFETIISSIGQIADIPSSFGVDTGKGNVIKANTGTLATSRKGVYAGGDIVTGPASVIGAIAQGRQAASSIDKYLGGNGIIDESLTPLETPDPVFGQDADFAYWKQATMPCISDKERISGFTEVELGFEENAALKEAKRCFRCDMRLRISKAPLPPIKVKI